MPIGPQGQVRPVSTISAAAMVCKIATGEIEEQYISDEHRRDHEELTAAPCDEDKD